MVITRVALGNSPTQCDTYSYAVYKAFLSVTAGYKQPVTSAPPGLERDACDDQLYSWRGAPIFEAVWRQLGSRQGSLQRRFTVLNVSFLDHRADGHVATAMRYASLRGNFSGERKRTFPLDCLHYCYPGPADFWSLALYNLLLNNERFSLSQQGRR